MPRLSLGLGLNLPRPIFIGGGGSPSVPVGALATYTAYSPSNFTLVTGDSINVWNDETTNANDLTQGTSGNQPVLVEDNTLTQFTASNQPTYNQVSGVDVMAFGASKYMAFAEIIALSGEFTIEIESDIDSSATNILLSTTGAKFWANGSVGQLFVRSQSNASFIFSGLTFLDKVTKIKIKRTLDTLEAWIDNVNLGQSFDVSGEIFEFHNLGSTSSDSIQDNLYSFKQWNSADDSGEPDFTLTPDPTKMRTSANVNPVLGDDVAKWYADEWSGYRDNHVLFDPVKYMEGLPAQAGDFTYIFKYQDDDQATAGAIVSSNIDSSGISNVDGDTTELIAGDATNYLFDNTGATSYRMVAYLKSGNDVYNVTDYVTTPTQDATGKDFNLTSLGKATSGKDMKVKEFYLYDRELVGTDLDYFFYLRSETGEILLPPLLPS